MLAAAVLYYFILGLSFSETMCIMSKSPLSSLCEEFSQSNDIRVAMLLGELASTNFDKKTLSSIDRGLRNKIEPFATDPYISHAFRGEREGAEYFSWDDLDTHNIFICIPEDRIDQWHGAINLMYAQLFRHLERRPDKHSLQGGHNVQTLVLMDEFARFGKLETITSAMSTLRSKNVNICLVIQSLAQLDMVYGEKAREVPQNPCT